MGINDNICSIFFKEIGKPLNSVDDITPFTSSNGIKFPTLNHPQISNNITRWFVRDFYLTKHEFETRYDMYRYISDLLTALNEYNIFVALNSRINTTKCYKVKIKSRKGG